MPVPTMPDIQTLSDFLVSEIIIAAGLPDTPFLDRLFRPLFHRATDRLARLGWAFNRTVAEQGTAPAARDLLAEFCHPVQAVGTGNIPLEGPLLVVSNHPGAFDTLVLFSQVARPDVCLISSEIPFIRALPQASRHFIFVSFDPFNRMAGIRQALRHLRGGGAILLFGSGIVDPDPSVYPPADALDHVHKWWPSAEFLLDRLPGANLVLATVSHVLSPRWARHPVTWLRRGGVDRRKLAEFGQVIQQLLGPGRKYLSPRVRFSRPCSVETLQREAGTGKVMPAIISRAVELLKEHIASLEGHENVPLPERNVN